MLILFFLLVLAVPSQASTIYSTGYEYADMTALQADGWTLTCSSSPCTTDLATTTVSGASPHGGSKMLRQTYAGVHCPSGNCSIGDATNSKIDRTFSTAELYGRVFMRWECNGASCGFGAAAGTKLHYINVSVLPNFFIHMFTEQNIGAVNQTTVTHQCPPGATPQAFPDVTCNLKPNISTATFPLNQWVCVEYHLSQSQVDIWTDGTLRASYTTGVIYPTTYNRVQIFRQDANDMVRYEDDFVLSTSRVGCGEASSASAPNAPTGVAVQ